MSMDHKAKSTPGCSKLETLSSALEIPVDNPGQMLF